MIVKRKTFSVVIFGLLAFAWGLFAQASRAEAQSGKSIFQGKTIKILVNSSAGGGTDSAARVVARFLPKYLPGNPSTFVQNMPGGGGVLANNYFYRRAKPDGLTFFQSSSATVTQFSRGGKRIKYDPRKFRAIGSINRGGSVLMIRKDVHARLLDPKAKPVVVGDSDGTRDWLATTLWGAEQLGWNVRFIYGYAGTGEMVLAFRQGEIEMMATANIPIIEDLVESNLVDVISVVGSVRRKDFPELQTFEELLGDKRPTGVSWQAYKFFAGPGDLDKPIFLPPRTPDNIASVVREAYLKLAKDPDFKKATTRFFGKGWVVRGAKETEDLVVETTSPSREVRDFLFKLRKKHGLPTG